MLQCAMLALRLRVSGLKLAPCAIHDTLQRKDWLHCSMQQDKCEITISQENTCLVKSSADWFVSSVRLGLFYTEKVAFQSSRSFEWCFWIKVQVIL
jgi:hypothetical protein